MLADVLFAVRELVMPVRFEDSWKTPVFSRIIQCALAGFRDRVFKCDAFQRAEISVLPHAVERFLGDPASLALWAVFWSPESPDWRIVEEKLTKI